MRRKAYATNLERSDNLLMLEFRPELLDCELQRLPHQSFSRIVVDPDRILVFIELEYRTCTHQQKDTYKVRTGSRKRSIDGFNLGEDTKTYYDYGNR